jgi:long-chain acyl-CoA synthetase
MPAPLLLCTLSEKATKEEKPTIVEQLSGFLSKMNDQLEHHEQVAKIIVLKDEWTLENGILTPTLKIKRKVVDELFQQQYNEWYKMQPSVAIL